MPLSDHLFGFGNRLSRVETLGAGVGAIHDRVAAIKPKRVFELVETFASHFIAAVGKPAVCLKQYSRTKKFVAVPPI